MKWMAFALSLVLLATLLYGCGKTQNTPAPTSPVSQNPQNSDSNNPAATPNLPNKNFTHPTPMPISATAKPVFQSDVPAVNATLSRTQEKLAFMKEKKIPVPPASHPRLFVNKSNIQMLRDRRTFQKNLNDMSAGNSEWSEIESAAKQPVQISILKDEMNNFNWDAMLSVQSRALIYLLDKDEKVGKEAITMGKNLMETFRTTNARNYQGSNEAGSIMTACAMVYDWCYSLMTAQDKQDYIKKFKFLGTYLEYPYPATCSSCLSGHEAEMSVTTAILTTGIACFDEDDGLYLNAADILCTQFIPARNFAFMGEMPYQGDSYGLSRMQFDMTINILFRAMGYPDMIGQQMGKIMYRPIYARRPDGQFFRQGDSYNGNMPALSNWAVTNGPLFAAGYYNEDPYIKNEFLKQYRAKSWQINPLFIFMFINEKITARTSKDLPYSRYFPSPQGSMIARTGWDLEPTYYSNTAMAMMNVGEYYFTNHAHFDSGSFQLYYKGALAIDSGSYVQYGDSHDNNYFKRAVAHNVMLLRNPNETFSMWSTPVANDGGAWYSVGGHYSIDLFKSDPGMRMGTVKAHFIGTDANEPNFTYLKGDLASAYKSRAENYTRDFVFMNMKNSKIPGVLIVKDHMTSAVASFDKAWLLHTMEEPVISANGATVSRTSDSNNGKMVLSALLPKADNLNIQKIGGPGHEYDVFGTNYPLANTPQNPTEESGSWRIQISPKQKAKDDTLLNVMQVMDNQNSPQPLTANLIENGSINGVCIGDRVVTFAKGYDLLNTSFEVAPVGISGKAIYLFTDLASGKWVVKNAQGKVVSTVTVTDAARCLVYEGTAEKLIISKQ